MNTKLFFFIYLLLLFFVRLYTHERPADVRSNPVHHSMPPVVYFQSNPHFIGRKSSSTNTLAIKKIDPFFGKPHPQVSSVKMIYPNCK